MKKVGHTSEFSFGIYWWTLKNTKNQNFEKMKKNCWRYHNFTHVYQKQQSYEVRFPRYGVRYDMQNFLSFSTIFFPFTPLTTTESKFWKNEKSNWIRHHFTHCTNNHYHMMYVSWYMECTRHTFLSFWVTVYPFSPLLTPKMKIWKKCKN